MGWLLKEKRGPKWKQGWKDQTLASISPPPMPLVAIFGIVILFLSLSYYMDYKAQMNRTIINFRLLFFLLPVLLIFMARYISFNGRFMIPVPRPQYDTIHRAGGSPWGVAVLVVVLLVMVSYQSSFQSKWFRPLWTSHYQGPFG